MKYSFTFIEIHLIPVSVPSQQLESQVRELEERRRAFEQEKKDWEEHNGVTLDELKRRSLEANSKEYVSPAGSGKK